MARKGRSRGAKQSAPSVRSGGAGEGAAASLQFSRINAVLAAAGVVSLVAGYILLAQGSITAAPLLLVLGYVVLLPLAIIL